MSIDPVGLSQLYSTQQAQALSAVSADAPMDPPSGDSTPPAAAGSNALTGTATSNLDSQTLQALLDLTQQDSGDTPQTNKTGQPGQTGQTGQVQHRHHHHGGGMRAPSAPTDPSQTASTAAASPATASGIESDTAEASLTSALLNA